MTTRLRIPLALAFTLCAFPVSATADPYWITYEGNDLPENEGWQRNWGNDEGAHEGDGAIRTVEDGILTMDSLYDLRVYDYACRYLYGEVDPDPGELFIAECRVEIDQGIGDMYDSTFGICSDDGMQLAFGLFPDYIESIWEDDVELPITPGTFHEYRVLSWDMQTYELYIDGHLAHEGTFWQGSLESKLAWGDGVRGAASLAHWDYVRFGVIPEPSAGWLVIAGLAVCVLRTLRSGMRRVVYLPILACILSASATGEPYWLTYEGNDLPEHEGWQRNWGNDEGAHEGDGAIRTVEDGILTMDSMYDLRVYDYACQYLYGALDPDPGELFVAEWRVYVEDWIGDYGHWDSKVSICSDDGWLLGLGLFPDHVESQFEDDVYIPIAPDVFHDYLLVSWDMQAYELYIDGELAHVGLFRDGTLLSKFSWGDCVSGAASLAHWDYVRFGVVPETCSLGMLICLCACAKRRPA